VRKKLVISKVVSVNTNSAGQSHRETSGHSAGKEFSQIAIHFVGIKQNCSTLKEVGCEVPGSLTVRGRQHPAGAFKSRQDTAAE
jgi:hypothetical protein